MDPIANMFVIIKNAQKVRKTEVVLPFSKVKHKIAEILGKAGYVGSITEQKDKFKQLKIKLKYRDGQPRIKEIKRVSTPGRRIYAPYDEISKIVPRYGLGLVSTSQGLLTGQMARQKKMAAR